MPFGLTGNQLLGAGFSPGQASAILGSTATTGISAAGTTIGTATDLAAVTNFVSTAAAGSGVQLPAGSVVNDVFMVYNDATGNSFYVYPDSASNRVNQLTAGAGVLVPNNTAAWFVKATSTRWLAFLSA